MIPTDSGRRIQHSASLETDGISPLQEASRLDVIVPAGPDNHEGFVHLGFGTVGFAGPYERLRWESKPAKVLHQKSVLARESPLSLACGERDLWPSICHQVCQAPIDQ